MKRLLSVMAGLLCALLLAAPCARAQGESPSQAKLYTYVAEWGVPRAQWEAMTKLMLDRQATMDKLVDDGTITGYGEGAVVLHTVGGMTHFNWFQASSIGGILRALDVVSGAAAASPVLATAKHDDIFFQSTIYGGTPGVHRDGYLWVGHFTMQPGKTGEWIGMFSKFVRPILDKLVSDGTLVAYQLYTPLVHTPGSNDTLNYGFITSGPNGIDKFFTAIGEAESANSFTPTAISSVEAPAGHFDTIAKVLLMREK